MEWYNGENQTKMPGGAGNTPGVALSDWSTEMRDHSIPSCQFCGALIPVSRLRYGREHLAKYCSEKCAQRAATSRPLDLLYIDLDKTCVRCGKPIPEERLRGNNRLRVKFCSRECSHHLARPIRDVALPTGTVGALGELVVSVDLLRHGFEVFRSVSQSCSCDLIAMKNTELLRVEVRTGNRNSNGKILAPVNRDQLGRFDILAIVLDDRDVVYVPDRITGADDPWCIANLLTSSLKDLLVRRGGESTE